uniref:BTB domain-containing protein n=1 Tax=Neogobius melanostomus TaxID=47308 RepID=A0A8C6TX65_9GOBI
MSCEESYLAIIRYLTDEREPYAPGTPGNTKRKIRKAAICYVVRNGTLFYQRRLKGQDEFNELEVVLQDERRKELITQAHIADTGDHLNQQATWEAISQKYWWRGILKTVKDMLRECPVCQSRRSEDGAGRLLGRPRRTIKHEEDEDEEDDGSLFSEGPWSKVSSRHELVFVDSKGEVNQFLPRHSGTMLEKLNQQRLNNQFCDITLLIEGEEFRAHKAILAKGAASTHEAVVDLSGEITLL